MQFRLKGLTGHGKNRIREHGELWEVLGMPRCVLDMDPKPVHPFIESVETGEGRWFDPVNFEIEEEINE